VFELRQYTLHPGQREVLIELFDREFVESQENLGMEIVGQFRDLDDPDRFVWLRGFPDMAARHRALSAFHGGEVWAAHRDVANATMVAFDDVLLLRPVAPEKTLVRSDQPRRPVGSPDRPGSLIAVTVFRLRAPADTGRALDLVVRRVQPLLAEAGGTCLATLRTETAPNTYTALPVREGEHVLVLLARFDDADAHARLSGSRGWHAAHQQLRPYLGGPPDQLRLQPTARSLLS
jgi:quinol monooxygenase YgiN